MPLPLDYLGSHIGRASTERVAPGLPTDLVLGNAEVDKFDVALGIKQYVFWLQIPVNNPFVVQVAKCLQNLYRIEANIVVREPFAMGDSSKQLSSRTVLQHEAVEQMRFESLIELEDEGMVDAAEYIPLVEQNALLVAFDDLLLLQQLQCVKCTV